jgi:hypothetical protein
MGVINMLEVLGLNAVVDSKDSCEEESESVNNDMGFNAEECLLEEFEKIYGVKSKRGVKL